MLTLQIDSLDYFQIEEALRAKIATWRATEKWLRNEDHGQQNLDPDMVTYIEECNSSEEAANIAEQYENILKRLNEQYQKQKS